MRLYVLKCACLIYIFHMIYVFSNTRMYVYLVLQCIIKYIFFFVENKLFISLYKTSSILYKICVIC